MELLQQIINISVILAVISFQVTTSLYLIEQPKDTEVTEGSNVVLKCKFDRTAQTCSWKRNTVTVLISGRYKYIDGSLVVSRSRDCSIEILNSTIEIDDGEWQCEATPQYSSQRGYTGYSYSIYSLNQKVTSRNAKVTIKPVMAVTVTLEPVDTEVTEGNNVVLNCKVSGINSLINLQSCLWKRNTSIVSISGRYKYVNRPALTTTKDCSIEIFNTTILFDSGEWQCGSTLSDDHVYTWSRTGRLTVKPASIFKEEPESQALSPNDTIILPCVLHRPFKTCHWIKNHLSVIIGNRYQFINGTGKNTTDCSLKIINGQPIDSGTWQCIANGDHTNRGYVSKVAVVAIIQSETSFATIPTSSECPVCPTAPLYLQLENRPSSASAIEATQVTKQQVSKCDDDDELHERSTVMLWIVIALLATFASVLMILNIKNRRNSKLNEPEEHLLHAKENYT